jgi:hypothetical protein
MRVIAPRRGRLRKLASGHMLFELAETSKQWDRFHVRNIGLAVQRRMARDFDGDSNKMRNYSAHFLNRTLELNAESWTGDQKSALENLSLVLGMIPGIAKWNPSEKPWRHGSSVRKPARTKRFISG